MMTNEHAELDELMHAIRDTGTAFEASSHLRAELAALGCAVSVPVDLWRQAVRAQRETEARHLAIFEFIRMQASEALR